MRMRPDANGYTARSGRAGRRTPFHAAIIPRLASETDTGYPVRMATRTRRRSLMRALKVTAARLQEWEDALPGLSLRTDFAAKQLIGELASVGVGPAQARAYRQAGYNALHQSRELLELAEAHVPPFYVSGMDNETVTNHIDDIIRVHSAGVPREDIRGHQLSAYVILHLRSLGVPTDYTAVLARSGVRSASAIQSAWESGLAPEYAAAAVEAR